MSVPLSVIAATRKRVPLLDKMLRSLRATQSMPVEVILRCDFDDRATMEYLSRSRDALFIVGPQLYGYATLATLVNEAARLSHGDLVIVVNDDAEFLTPGWDQKLLDAAKPYTDGIFDLGVDTVMNNENFVFPCTSRKVIELIGIHDERLIYSDIWLRDVMMPLGRAIRVPDVTIRHDWVGLTEDQAQAMRYNRPEMHTKCVLEAREKVRTALCQ
jgi:hypothetical protein